MNVKTTVIGSSDVRWCRPGMGVHPEKKPDSIGVKDNNDMKSFGLYCESAQEKNDWRAVLIQLTGIETEIAK